MPAHVRARRRRAPQLPTVLSTLLVAAPAALLATGPVGARLAAADTSVATQQAQQAAVPALGHQVVAEAANHQGKPYVWGAVGPHAFDCSGFTLYVFRRFGRSLPHSSSAQYRVVRHVPQAARQLGDLIFSYDRGGRIYHVGIYAGGNAIWHAPHSGDVVRRSSLWTSRYWVGRPA